MKSSELGDGAYTYILESNKSRLAITGCRPLKKKRNSIQIQRESTNKKRTV